MRVKHDFVAVFENSVECPFEVLCDADQRDYTSRVEAALAELLRREKVLTSRKNPQTMPIQAWELEIQGLQIVRKVGKKYDIMPPVAPMTQEEFAEEQSNILEKLPREFFSPVASYCWEHAHSAGFEEVLSSIKELTDVLDPAIKTYTTRLLAPKAHEPRRP